MVYHPLCQSPAVPRPTSGRRAAEVHRQFATFVIYAVNLAALASHYRHHAATREDPLGGCMRVRFRTLSRFDRTATGNSRRAGATAGRHACMLHARTLGYSRIPETGAHTVSPTLNVEGTSSGNLHTHQIFTPAGRMGVGFGIVIFFWAPSRRRRGVPGICSAFCVMLA